MAAYFLMGVATAGLQAVVAWVLEKAAVIFALIAVLVLAPIVASALWVALATMTSNLNATIANEAEREAAETP